jgi:hypothetical protein
VQHWGWNELQVCTGNARALRLPMQAIAKAAAQAQMKSAIGRLAQEFEELARRDARLTLDARNGCSVLVAMRQWEFSEFTRLRRKR